jgi:NADPH:quinone reductase-like Zn-dependent oxidoreductase
MDATQVPAMRSLRLHAAGGPAGLTLEPAPVPAPGTGDVLVRVHGASYTPGELDWPSTWVDRSGHDRRPVIPGHEVSGVVVGLGWGAAGLAVGDEVFGLTDWYRDGAFAEYVAVEARDLAPKPPGLRHAAAATLPLAGLTAWQGLFRHGRLQAGETVLVLGAGGGVGSLAVQLAHHAGARVVGLGRARDFEAIARAGADVVLDGAVDRVDAERVGLVFDTVGGATLEAAFDALHEGGRVVSVAEPPAPERLARHRAAGRYFVVEPDRDGLVQLARLVEREALLPAVGRTCALSEGRATIMAKHRGDMPGKVALMIP